MSRVQPRVVIAGAGPAGLETVLALRAAAGAAVDIDVVEPSPVFVYRPGSVTAPFEDARVTRFETQRLVEDAGGRWWPAAVELVEPDARRVVLTGRGVLEYDELVVAVGATTRVAVPGALTYRDGRDAAALRALVDDLGEGRKRRAAFVVPPGSTWALPAYELALLTAAATCDAPAVEIGVVTAESAPLEVFGPGPSAAVRSILAERRVGVWTGMPVTSYARGAARLSLDVTRTFDCDAVVALPRLTGPALPGLRHDAEGFLVTGEDGTASGCDVLVAGDAGDAPCKQGGLAAWHADRAVAVLCRRLGLRSPADPGPPVLRAVLLTGTGRLFLRRDLGEPDGEVGEEPLWQPPAKIASGRLAAFLALHPEMYGDGHVTSPDGAATARP